MGMKAGVNGRPFPWPAWLHTYSWSGPLKQKVVVVGASRTKFRIQSAGGVVSIRLAGSRRFLDPGKTALVPGYSLSYRKDHE